MSDNIPYEIQMEIIKKVPDVKSLLRCRAVSKPWKSFIDSSEFIADYGVRHNQPHLLLLRYIDSVDPSEVKYVSFLDDVSFPIQQLDFAPNVPDLVIQVNFSKVIGSSCGLWCLHGYNSWGTQMVVIWNPSIRKSVGILVPFVLTSSSNKTSYFRFGVCPSTYDPAIVVMTYLEDKWQVGIFTLSSKTWKMIPSTNVPRESIRVRPTTQVAIDRFIFWVAFDRIVGNDGVYQYKSLILSFDFITHDFKEVHLPVSIANQVSPLSFSISKLNESLVVSKYTDEVNKIVYDVWMMGEEGGVMTSFSKLFTINTPDSSIRRLLGFRKSGEPITETVKKGQQFAALKVYEPCSQHINDLGIYGEVDSFFICPYKETLLLADYSGCCIISSDS